MLVEVGVLFWLCFGTLPGVVFAADSELIAVAGMGGPQLCVSFQSWRLGVPMAMEMFTTRELPEFLPSIAWKFPSQAPAIFSFTTSNQDFYRRFHLELRVVFLLEEQPLSFIAPVETCHDVIAEASDFFPAPLSCYGSSALNSTVNDTVLFGIRFGMLQTLQPGSSYRFVVPGLVFTQTGNAQWRLEFWVDGSSLIETAVANVAGTSSLLPSLASLSDDSSLVESFVVRGGSSMIPNQQRSLLLSVRLNTSYPLPTILPGKMARLAVTLFPMLLWDQQTPACILEDSSIIGSCEFTRVLPHPSYNILMLVFDAQLLTQVSSIDFRVTVLAPDAWGFLPAELILGVLTEDWAAGPFFQEDLTSNDVESLEMSCQVAPYPTVQMTSSNRLEGSRGSIILRFVTGDGATLRGLSLRNDPRDVNISIMAPPFFVFTGASNIPETFALGTDRAPVVSIDGRHLVFSLGGQPSLALGHVEYAVQLEMINPTRYFWQISSEEPWRFALVQGPRPGCRACTRTRFETTFVGPEIQFQIFDFQVTPHSLLLGQSSSVTFTFRLLNDAEQLQLYLPTGTTATSCAFAWPSNVDGDELRCVSHGDIVGVIRRGFLNDTIQEMLPLFLGLRLSFRVEVLHPAEAFADSRGGIWSLQALDASGTVIGRLAPEEEVRLPLYSNVIPLFLVNIQDARAGIVATVQVQLTSGVTLQPGDFIQVTSPPDFAWSFLNAELILRLPVGVDADLPVQVADVIGRVLRFQVIQTLQSTIPYGFEARIQTPSQPPPDYYWTIETYGAGADAGVPGLRYETGSLQAFELHLLTEAKISPWTSVRGATGPISVSFRTYQAVNVYGQLLIRSPSDLNFLEPCFISELQLGEAGVTKRAG
eukprot:symbB.v1.2.017040.t2/scaffold1317.1/size125501/7